MPDTPLHDNVSDSAASAVRSDARPTPKELEPYLGQAPKVAAFFDLDKTVVAKNSAFAVGREFINNGLISPVAALQLTLAQATYMIAGHNSEQMDATRDQLTKLVTGWEVEAVREIAEETLKTVISPSIYTEAQELITFHQNLGHEVIIISASVTELVVPIARELGVHQVVASELATKDGVYTGDVLFYAKGPAKAAEIQRLATEYGYDLDRSFAYSDSATDIPMLEQVGNAVAVNPDRALRRHAMMHDWEIKTFKNPEPLFNVPTSREIGIGAGAVAGVAALTAGGFWLFKNYKR
ncbi:HAD family hydrolase [Staphylococcus chromogenes]|nr:HAD family hydrolase [Staphylococcus chromogenes]